MFLRHGLVIAIAICTGLLSTSVVRVSDVEAQELEDPEDRESNYKFYPHDYARSTFEGKGDENSQGKTDKATNPKSAHSGRSPDTSTGTAVNSAPITEASGKPIESISLIASNLDFVSLKNCFTTLLNIFNEKAVRPSTLFLLGLPSESYTQEIKDLSQRLAMLGVVEKLLFEPPANFKVSKVPSWIITLKAGDVLLEGLDSPERFINSKGEFVDPKTVPQGEGN